MTLFDGVYINGGGGKVLLEYIIQTLITKNEIDKFHFLLDSRLESYYLPYIPNKTIIIASESSRKEFYRNQIAGVKIFFCFANVPPPVEVLNNPVYVFFHNAHILRWSLGTEKFKLKFKYFVKYKYIKLLNKSSYIWIVQTPHLQKLLLQKMTALGQKVYVMPFFEENRFLPHQRINNFEAIKFLYVASGQIQKNHNYLFDVWELLYEKHKINFALYITIENPNPDQAHRIKALQDKGINIVNFGDVSFEEIGTLYAQCQYLVFPSFIESFGLPLVEATNAGCKVLAIDSPYVYEVVKPSATFNVKDKNSLAKLIVEISCGNILASSKVVIKDHTKELLKLLIN